MATKATTTNHDNKLLIVICDGYICDGCICDVSREETLSNHVSVNRVTIDKIISTLGSGNENDERNECYCCDRNGCLASTLGHCKMHHGVWFGFVESHILIPK